ncbi:hypothetical protein EYF80_062566 [Liparis tanakae]|uniref:Uncharacterized protein n=1 Tax=Liparis tanakae TaxID=230148 RepID=A0A4Z2EFI3_9TELE|nr:hypothetical protein EYF80_062566 [Liparis tanakae]
MERDPAEGTLATPSEVQGALKEPIALKAKRLAAHARKMSLTLRFLPVTFTRSKENSTVFFTK